MQQDKPTPDRFLAWQERHPALNFLLVVTAPLALLGALYLLTLAVVTWGMNLGAPAGPNVL